MVLDKEDAIGRHQTGRNSGVIHAGIYYAPGSLKAQLCVSGARELYAFCERHAIAAERCGKLIVALDESELPGLDELERRGRANGVAGLRRIDPDELAELEPAARGIAALHSPDTGIVDFTAVARALRAELEDAGGSVALGSEVTGITPNGRAIRIAHRRGVLEAGHALVCAGAWSDRLAVQAGAPREPQIVPFRGAYLRLRPERRHLVRSMIYPVPDPRLPFLGVHLTRHADGDVLVGPTALLAGGRDAYRLRQVRPRDLAATLTWPGTPRMMRALLADRHHRDRPRREPARDGRHRGPLRAGAHRRRPAARLGRRPRPGARARRQARGRLRVLRDGPRAARPQRAVARRHVIAGDRPARGRPGGRSLRTRPLIGQFSAIRIGRSVLTHE